MHGASAAIIWNTFKALDDWKLSPWIFLHLSQTLLQLLWLLKLKKWKYGFPLTDDTHTYIALTIGQWLIYAVFNLSVLWICFVIFFFFIFHYMHGWKYNQNLFFSSCWIKTLVGQCEKCLEKVWVCRNIKFFICIVWIYILNYTHSLRLFSFNFLHGVVVQCYGKLFSDVIIAI